MSGGVSIKKDAPPFVTFDYQEVGPDAEASAKAGRYIPRVRAIATIRQIGDKFAATERDAEEWLADLKRKSIEGTYNPEWAQRFQMQYDAFIKGEELPRHGTPIKTWAAINREQVIRLIACGMTTIEDLAALPDAGLGQVGLDGRYLRDLARTFIASGHDAAGNAKKITDLEQENRTLKESIERMEARLAALEPKGKKAA